MQNESSGGLFCFHIAVPLQLMFSASWFWPMLKVGCKPGATWYFSVCFVFSAVSGCSKHIFARGFILTRQSPKGGVGRTSSSDVLLWESGSLLWLAMKSTGQVPVVFFRPVFRVPPNCRDVGPHSFASLLLACLFEVFGFLFVLCIVWVCNRQSVCYHTNVES